MKLAFTLLMLAGLGGTHWGRIEGHRAEIGSVKQRAAMTFRNWGIDTVQSVFNAVFHKSSI